MIPIFLQKWIFLNVLRVLTIVSCGLVIASTALLMQRNFANPKKDDFSADSEVDYYPGTDIPVHTWGSLWSSLHHVYNILILFLVILSEISWGGILDRFFKNILPFLGPNWGTGMLGGLLILLGADTLSRSIGRFPLISNWLLISVAMVNVLSGMVFRAKAKLLRSPKGFKKPVADKLELLADAKARAEKLRDAVLPTTAPAPEEEKRKSIGGAVLEKVKGVFDKQPSAPPPPPVASTVKEGMVIPPAIPFRPAQETPTQVNIPMPIPEIQRPPPIADRSIDSVEFTIVNSRSIEVRPSSAEIVQDRSPGLVASWRAAALEAQIKARTRATKKNIYLGSEEWKRSSSARDEDSASLPPYASSSRDMWYEKGSERGGAQSRSESRQTDRRYPPRSESRQSDRRYPPRSESRGSERPFDFRSESRQSERRYAPSRSESRSKSRQSERRYPPSRSESRSETNSRSDSRQSERRYDARSHFSRHAPSGRHRHRRTSSLDHRRRRYSSSYYSEDEEWLNSPIPPHRGYESDTPTRTYGFV